MLLHALQIMKLSAHPRSEFYVKNIIMTTKEDDLSELKSLTDSKGDINSMHKLIFVDIRNEQIKNEILSYIAKQAKIQEGHNLIGSKKGEAKQKLLHNLVVCYTIIKLMSLLFHCCMVGQLQGRKEVGSPGERYCQTSMIHSYAPGGRGQLEWTLLTRKKQ